MIDCEGADYRVKRGTAAFGVFPGSYTGDGLEQEVIRNFRSVVMEPGSALENVTLDSPGSQVFLERGAGHRIRNCKLHGVNIVGVDVGRVVLEGLYLVNMGDVHGIHMENSREYNRLSGIEVLGTGAVTSNLMGTGVYLEGCDLVHLRDVFVIGCAQGLVLDNSWVNGSGLTVDSCWTGIRIQGEERCQVMMGPAAIRAHGTGLDIGGGEVVCFSGVQSKGSGLALRATRACQVLSAGGCRFHGKSVVKPVNFIGDLKQFERRVAA